VILSEEGGVVVGYTGRDDVGATSGGVFK